MSQQFNLSWRIGGPQGSGIDRGTDLLAHAMAMAGFEVSAHREYHSNIIGRHSYSDVVITDAKARSHNETYDILICLDAESVVRHAKCVNADGIIIYNRKDADTTLASLPYLDQRLKDDLADIADTEPEQLTVSNVIRRFHDNNILLIDAPLDELLEELAQRSDTTRARARRAINVLAVSIATAIVGLDRNILFKTLESTFRKSQAVIDLNRQAIDIAYTFGKPYRCHDERVIPEREKQPRLWLTGFQSTALGKLAAGMGFQSYYPISPATDESSYLETVCRQLSEQDSRHLPVIIQSEDELAAIGMCCGAALTGARAATATSGPGFSLMAETLGWAGMNETPVVITLYQRGGPATGMPTRTEQGDLLFAVHAGHGEFPRIVLASSDVESCYHDAIRAFDYAERYQVPVIHLLDKTLASTSMTIEPFENPVQEHDRGKRLAARQDEDAGRVQRFHFTEDGISARPVIGKPGQAFWTTGVEHDENGLVSEDPVIREKMLEKRAHKLELANEEIPLSEKIEILGDREAELVIISWGSNKRPILDAMNRLAQNGIQAKLLMVRLLAPFPVKEIKDAIASGQQLVSVECNQSGQFNRLLRENTGHAVEHEVLKYSGRPHTGQALFEAFHAIIDGTAESRIVIRNPWE